jgi:hypothetical protein
LKQSVASDRDAADTLRPFDCWPPPAWSRWVNPVNSME